ncbi:MAG: DUF523 and DUF1722 domain-containing protein [Smithellaceae bacterium]|nr:DUF523 and DUF1722 domain-containing protein [Smithellaceae bacterium]
MEIETQRIKIGISACLLGEDVRYDGADKRDPFLVETMGRYVEYLPVCPEVECGLSVPREAMHLVGDPSEPRIVTIKTGIDHTEGMLAWAGEELSCLAKEGLAGFIFKARSPSCGVMRVKLYARGRLTRKGQGIFAGALIGRFPLLPVEEDTSLYDPSVRDNFVTRVFAMRRWQGLRDDREMLVRFHEDHRLLVMSHSPAHGAALEKLLVTAGKRYSDRLKNDYGHTFMEALTHLATPQKNARVLRHVVGLVRKHLTKDQEREIGELIKLYRQGMLPLAVPLSVVNHYVRLHGRYDLTRQVYLCPDLREQMLRYHA